MLRHWYCFKFSHVVLFVKCLFHSSEILLFYLNDFCCFHVHCYMFVLSCGNSPEDYSIFFCGVTHYPLAIAVYIQSNYTKSKNRWKKGRGRAEAQIIEGRGQRSRAWITGQRKEGRWRAKGGERHELVWAEVRGARPAGSTGGTIGSANWRSGGRKRCESTARRGWGCRHEPQTCRAKGVGAARWRRRRAGFQVLPPPSSLSSFSSHL